MDPVYGMGCSKMKILPLKKWKVVFADGSYVIVDARTNWEAVKLAKPLSRFTTVHAAPVIGWNRRMMRKNIAITPEMVKRPRWTTSHLLEGLSRLDRDSRGAKEIRRQLSKRVSFKDATVEKIIISYLKGEPTKEEYVIWIDGWIDKLVSKEKLERMIKVLLLGFKRTSSHGFNKNVAITSEMVKEAKGEGSKLLERLSKMDRNSKEARKIRRQLRKLGVNLSKAVSKEHLRKKVAEGERRRYIKKSIETPLMTKRERGRILHPVRKISTKLEERKHNQVLDTAQVLTQKVGYKSKPELVKRLMEIYPRLTEERARGIAYNVLIKKNPPPGAIEIYGKIIAIEAQKGLNSTFPKENFRHEFKPGSKIFGLPDGSILIKGKKKLWKKFKY